MPFRTNVAISTLRAVAEALADQRAALDPITAGQVTALIRQNGPQIATADTFGVISQVKKLLEALWLLRDNLPPAAAQALKTAYSSAEDAALRSAPAADLDALLKSLLKVVDFRVFGDPAPLSEQVALAVSEHRDRLTDKECADWQRLETAYPRPRSQDAADAYLHQVEALLGSYPQVRKLLDDGKTYVRKPVMRDYRPGGWPAPIKGFPSPQGPGESAMPDYPAPSFPRAQPPPVPKSVGPLPTTAVQRYGNVYFPTQVLLTQKQIPLVVHIAQKASEVIPSRVSGDKARISLQLGPLTLILYAEGFALEASLGGEETPNLPAARTVRVEPDRDCEPVVFFLTPQSAGSKRISIDVYQFNRQAASLAFETEVVAQGALSKPENVAFEPLALTSVTAGADVKLPDLELRVTLSSDRRTLTYTVRAPNEDGINFRPAGQSPLADEPQKYFQPTFDRLSTLARKMGDERTPAETAAALDELSDIGTNLYEALFSDELRQEYARFRAGLAGQKSLLIISDDPWIPWEMVRPAGLDAAGQAYVDPPLCEMFRLARWLAGPGAPDQMVMLHGVWVTPADNLQAAKIESDYFAELHRRQWGIELQGPLSKVPEVESRFVDGQTEFFHFSCHGNINTDDPNESKLKLDAGLYLRPSQITGMKKLGLSKSRPMVFLNACHAGRVGFGLTQLGGWAQRFLGAGASAFIGSQWEIRDELAAQFAKEFYNRLWGLDKFAGQGPLPIGEAFYQARKVIKDADPANPTWLAYVLYGDPQGQVLLGK
ncbi:MAG: CHAT domain-containing protein [Chloroflexi bacterium]|nr:CHAT domain-containing protein [Chloroflexota bacterium]